MFLDHNSDFTYVHLLKSQNGYEAVEPREYLEAYDKYHGVDNKNYHDKNGIFRDA